MSNKPVAISTVDEHRLFSFIHIGDLHLTSVKDGEQPIQRVRRAALQADLSAMLDQIHAIRVGAPNFVFLPGDIADNGLKAEYSFLEAELKRTLFDRHVPVDLIPGDHDRQWGTMTDFAEFRAVVRAHGQVSDPVRNTLTRYLDGDASVAQDIDQFYYTRTIEKVRCIFLDCISAGYGRKGFGLDFRLGTDQLGWLMAEVARATADRLPCAVFMHCYPDDLADRDERAALAGLFWNAGVRLVEMGHTHYNELAPDGRTLYATARSVGQNEDGPVGFVVGAIDATDHDDIVTSWRFKQSQLGWPFVLITSPADRRLATAPLRRIDSGRRITVRALLMSDKAVAQLCCECSVDGGAWVSMRPEHGGVFEIDVPWHDGSKHIAVRVMDQTTPYPCVTDMDTIEPAPVDFKLPSMPNKLGSDKQALASWVVKGVRGDQAGPNRSGFRW